MPTIKVTLNQSTTPWTLQLDTNPVSMPRNANTQDIHWHLAGNAYAGEFEPTTGSSRGLSWVPPPPSERIFHSLTRSPKKKALTLKDSNTDASTKGAWGYVLRVKLDGTVYTTRQPTTVQGGGDPSIKNN